MGGVTCCNMSQLMSYYEGLYNNVMPLLVTEVIDLITKGCSGVLEL